MGSRQMADIGPRAPLVSAIMPTYNASRYLADAVESVLRQTFSDWELIVYDDGSTDQTQDILRRYRDPRIRVERSATNLGRGGARNQAIRLARGRYVAPCDSDDVSLPDRFAHEVQFLETHPEIDVVSAHMACFWEGHPPEVRFTFPEDNEQIQRRFARGMMGIAHGASMIRAHCFERFGSYDESLRRAEDLDFFLRIRRQCRFHTLPEVLYLYRRRDRAIPLSAWLEESAYTRFSAFRHATAQTAGSDPGAYQRFLSVPVVRARLYTIDIARYVVYWARSYLQPRRTLR
jgi:glycosyltransferase involved in cell wall biosynthesis